MLYRTLLIIGVAWMLVTGIILVLLLALSWQNVRSLDPIKQHIAYQAELDSLHDTLALRVIPDIEVKPIDTLFLQQYTALLAQLSEDDRVLSAESATLIRAALAALRHDGIENSVVSAEDLYIALSRAQKLVREALSTEISAYRSLVKESADYGERQFLVSIILAVMIPTATMAFLIFFRRRVFAPLNDLSYLISLLSRKDYSAAMTDNIDPLMAPLFEQYNRMVKRMRDLDAGHIKREGALQKDVEQATRALIQQHVALAHAERMAAVGDVSARLAHDLRNPVSGVLMALTNLRGEVEDDEHQDRLALAIGELERVSRLLNNLLNESKMAPERPKRLQINRIVEDLIKLMRYQISKNITITTDVPQDLYCRLPESGLRHVLLNLMVNAAHAIGAKDPGSIMVSSHTDEKQIKFTVEDNGPGFPKELLDVGVHEHGSWRKGGNGIGLATVKRFALAHGGTLEMKNRSGSGAIVVLSLPGDLVEHQ